MVQRREIKFENWDEVLADLNRLATCGYVAAGKWNLEQNAKHLNDWISYPVLGFPTPPLVMRCIAAILRNTIGPRKFKQMLAEGKMPAGNPTFASTIYRSTDSDTQAVEQLKESIERFKCHQGEMHPSPIFGPMDKRSAEQLQLIHFAHHLSFLLPNEQPTQTR